MGAKDFARFDIYHEAAIKYTHSHLKQQQTHKYRPSTIMYTSAYEQMNERTNVRPNE